MMTTRASRQRWHLGSTIAVVLCALALLGAACSGSTTARAGASQVDGTADDGPGVTQDTVKIGFVLLDTTSLAKALKLDFPDQGDQAAQVAALVEAINAEGGIGGRRVEAVTREFEALFDTADTEEKLCNEFTQDDEVFAVMLWGMFQENLRPCFAQSETIMVENTLYPLPAAAMEDLAPYYMAPNFPVYEDVIAGLDGVFEQTGFLEDGTVGVLGVDTAANRAIYSEQLEPILEAAGSPSAETRWIDLTDSANTRAGYEQAVIAYKAAGVDRLVTLGGSRLLSFFLDFATKQDFSPRLVLTSYDNIDFNTASYPETMADAVGLSASPSWDFTEEQLASPDNDAEAACLEIYDDAGIELGGRSEARTAQYNCDALMFLAAAAQQAGIDSATPLNAGLLAQGALELGDSWQAGQNYRTELAGIVAGAAAYQAFEFDTATATPVLVGDPMEFG